MARQQHPELTRGHGEGVVFDKFCWVVGFDLVAGLEHIQQRGLGGAVRCHLNVLRSHPEFPSGFERLALTDPWRGNQQHIEVGVNFFHAGASGDTMLQCPSYARNSSPETKYLWRGYVFRSYNIIVNPI